MKRWLPVAGWALAIVLLAGLYAGVATLLYHIGAIAPAAAFIIERAQELLAGSSLTYPPLPVLVYAALARPALASAIVGTVATASLLWFAFHRMQDVVSASLASIALLTPIVTTLAIGDAPFWSFAAIAAWSLYMIARYVENPYSLYVFQAGLLIGVAFFIDIRIELFAAVLAVALFALYAARERARGMSVALVLVFPVIYFSLAWAFVAWIFTGQPWMPIPPPGEQSLAQAYPIEVLYLFALTAVAAAPRAHHRRFLVAVFATVPVVIGVCALTRRAFSAGEFVLLGVACTIAATTQIGNLWLRRFVALGTVGACLWVGHVLPAPPLQTLGVLQAAVASRTVAAVGGTVVSTTVAPVLTLTRYAIAVVLAVGIVLLARHSLRRLTGRTL